MLKQNYLLVFLFKNYFKLNNKNLFLLFFLNDSKIFYNNL